jgi:hypothetical protein
MSCFLAFAAGGRDKIKIAGIAIAFQCFMAISIGRSGWREQAT